MYTKPHSLWIELVLLFPFQSVCFIYAYIYSLTDPGTTSSTCWIEVTMGDSCFLPNHSVSLISSEQWLAKILCNFRIKCCNYLPFSKNTNTIHTSLLKEIGSIYYVKPVVISVDRILIWPNKNINEIYKLLLIGNFECLPLIPLIVL